MTEPYITATAQAALNTAKSTYIVPEPAPLPGVVIFVHGVNSDGEWYNATEEGLCAGLNRRLARCESQMVYGGVTGGTLTPVKYSRELDDNGFISRDRSAKNFITSKPNHSPIIRFRWGYKATLADVKEYGHGIFLNEHNYWGGGPFANGCTALPDQWKAGVDPSLGLSITAQDVNPEPNRDVFKCPPRHYYAHAADRLARLVGHVRKMQPDVPITVVGHSQGTMIVLASAFIGEECDGIADNYVIANSPYNVEDSLFFDNVAQSDVRDAEGRSGRQTGKARIGTLANLATLMRTRIGTEQSAAQIDARCANPSPIDGSAGYSAATDCHTPRGRVMVYCNPHDRVISGTTVRGIGWMGLTRDILTAINAGGTPVFHQRVFAQGWPMGRTGTYRYWEDRYNAEAAKNKGFWYPKTSSAFYRPGKAMDARPSFLGKLGALLMTIIGWPLSGLLWTIGQTDISAEPDKGHAIPLDAPPLPPSSHNYLPRAKRLDDESDAFDQGRDAPGDYLDAARARSANDPYGTYLDKHAKDAPPKGNAVTESELRYEMLAQLRMRADREKLDRTKANRPFEETDEEWQAWARQEITDILKKSADVAATDHSTIMTHPQNAEHVLAYDVAAGVSKLTPEQWNELRVAADWRLLPRLFADGHPFGEFAEYFEKGTLNELPLADPKNFGDERRIPSRIVNERNNRSRPPISADDQSDRWSA